MNWKKIILFGVLFFLASFGAGSIFGFDGMPTHETALREFVAVAVAGVLTLACLSFLQRDRALLHVALAALVGWAPSFVPPAIRHDDPLGVWLASLTVLGVVAVSGFALGLAARKMFVPPGKLAG